MGIKVMPTLGFQIPKQGEHIAQIVSYKEVDGLNLDWGNQYLFQVEFDVDGENLELYHYTSQKFSPESKLGLMVEAILEKSPLDYAEDNPLDLDDLLYKPVKVFIKHEERGGKKRAIIQVWSPLEDEDNGIPL